MKRVAGIGFLIFSCASGQVIAQVTNPCLDPPNGYPRVTGLSGVLTGQAVNANGGGENWNEIHGAGGALCKVGLGPGDPVDPTVVVGSWGTNDGLSQVTYSYTGGSSYNWIVRANGSTYYFCNGTELIATGVLGGGSACPPP